MRSNFGKFLCCGVVALLVFACLIFVEYYAGKSFRKATVVVAKADVPSGVLVSEDNKDQYFTTTEVPANTVSENALADLNDIEKIILKSAMSKNEVLTKNNMVSPEEHALNFKDPWKFSFKVSDASYAVSGTVRRGDVITLHGIKSGSTEDKEILTKAYVEEAYTSDMAEIKEDDTTSVATAFTVYVEKADVPRLNQQILDSTLVVALWNNVAEGSILESSEKKVEKN